MKRESRLTLIPRTRLYGLYRLILFLYLRFLFIDVFLVKQNKKIYMRYVFDELNSVDPLDIVSGEEPRSSYFVTCIE
jgi:hypothetical protein